MLQRMIRVVQSNHEAGHPLLIGSHVVSRQIHHQGSGPTAIKEVHDTRRIVDVGRGEASVEIWQQINGNTVVHAVGV